MIKIWNAPKESINGCSDFSFEFNGIDTQLKISYSNFGEEKHIVIKFAHTVCFKHNTNYLFMPNLDSFECLCEVKNSEWINELKKFNSEYPIEKFKHFIIDNQNDGRFEIIAETYAIENID